MSYRLILTKASTAMLEEVAPEDALDAARAAWDGGGWSGVRLLRPDGALYWKRGGPTSDEAELRDMAALARTAGLSRLALACPAISGLSDIDAPLSTFANSVEVAAGDPALDGPLRPASGPPRLRDLLAHLDARLAGSATLTSWCARPGPWPNRAHWRAEARLVA